MKKSVICLLMFFVLLVVSAIPVQAKEYQFEDVVDNDTILLPGDVVVFSEDMGSEYLCTNNMVIVDDKTYYLSNMHQTPFRDLFYASDYKMLIPSLEDIISCDLENLSLYQEDGEYLDDEELSLFVERIRRSRNIAYKVNMVRNGSAGYIAAVTILFDYLPINISYENTLGSDNDNPIIYEYTDGVIKLLPLEKDGYVFEGWYSDPEFQYRVDELTPEMTDDLVLYAKWSEVKEPQIINPETTTPIMIIGGIILLVLIVSEVVYFYKKRNLKESD